MSMHGRHRRKDNEVGCCPRPPGGEWNVREAEVKRGWFELGTMTEDTLMGYLELPGDSQGVHKHPKNGAAVWQKTEDTHGLPCMLCKGAAEGEF